MANNLPILSDLATYVALDPVFQTKGQHIDNAMVINQATHDALFEAYKARKKKPHKLADAILQCQRFYERKRREQGYFGRQHFASSADYADYIQPLLVAQRKAPSFKGQSLAPWQVSQKLKALLQF